MAQEYAQEYVVKSGDTLSDIAERYGVTPSDVTGYRSGDPNLIYPGEILNIGTPAEPPTEPPIEPTNGLKQGLELPEGGQVDQITAARVLMRQIANKAQQEAIGGGLEATMGGLEEKGYDLSRMSGNITARIIDFVQSGATSRTQESFKTMQEVLSSIQTNTNANLQMLLDSGAISNLDDDALQGLTITGMSLDTLKQLRNTSKANAAAIDSYVEGIESGKIDISDVPSGSMDSVVKEVDWSKIPQGVDDDITTASTQGLFKLFDQLRGINPQGEDVGGKFVDLRIYREMLAEWIARDGKPAEFHTLFGNYLSEEDREVFGII